MGGPDRDVTNGRRRLVRLCLAGVLVLGARTSAAQVVSGSFVGDGAGGRKITGLGFRPDLVLVKGDDMAAGAEVQTSAVMRTSTMGPGDVSKPVIATCCNPATAASPVVANQITSIDADGFTLGSDRRVAANGITFYWAAFKANAYMRVGKYTGDGAASHPIPTVGFSPDFVIVLPENTGRGIQACSAAPAGRSYDFDVGAWLSNQITSLNAGGFTVSDAGTYHHANVNGVVYHYVAWDEAAGFVDVGSYSGDGTNNRPITGVGFRPEFLFAKFIYNINSPPSSSPPGHFRTVSMPYDQSWDYGRTVGGQHLQDMLLDGFQIGSAMTINRAYADCNADGPGCRYFYVAINQVPLNPPPLGVADGGSTITVTAPTSFELTFDTTYGGGASIFYDLTEDSGRTNDLAGGPPAIAGVGVKTLFHVGILSGGTWYTPDDDTGNPADAFGRWNGSPPKLDLIEATPTRVRVRQESFYSRLCDTQPACTAGTLAGIKGVGDYSVYPSGKMAVRWTQSITSAVAFTDRDLALGVYSECPPGSGCANLTAYSESAPIASGGSNPAGDDFLLAKREVDLRRTDFLRVQHQDWGLADKTGYDQNVAFLDWRDYSPVVSPLDAGTTETWSYLDYFKPTGLASNADTAVTYRGADYRTPAAPVPSPGSVWHDAAENSAADAFNEAEAAYVFDADPVSGLAFTLNAAPASPRYQPFFKVRQWRSFVDAPTVTLGGTALTKNVDYQADAKPVARALYAQNIVWYSPLQSDITGMIYLGQPATSTGGAYGPARYGNGFQVTADGQYLSLPIADINMAKGAIEFWFQPAYASTDGTLNRNIAGFYFDNQNSFLLQKRNAAGANALVFTIESANVISTYTVSAANYSWRIGDWVHIRLEWDDSLPLATQQRILLNGVEPPHTAPTSDFAYNINLKQMPFIIGKQRILGSTLFSPGLYDEVYVYAGSSTTPAALAHGGLASHAEESLASTSRNATLDFAPLGTESQGEYFFVGSDSRFRGLNVALQQAGVGATSADIAWEYWNGTTWADLKAAVGVGNFTDGTNGFTQPTGTVYWTADPPGWSPYSVKGGPDLYYVRLHLVQSAAGYGLTPPIERVIKTDILLFQYTGTLVADAAFTFAPPAPTAVELMSFDAAPADRAVDLTWRTASELDNLGFHLHRSPSSEGPWTRITSSLIPGLGSSPVGASYSWRDSGLVNGTRYYYRLEDVDTASVSTFHGPVSTVPGTAPPVPEPSPPREDGGDDGGGDGSERGEPGDSEPPSTSCPSWVLAAAPDSSSGVCTRYGDPESTSLQLLARDASSATVELRTGGFWALRGAAGEVQVFVPGLEFPADPAAPALPLRRALVEAAVGKQVELVSAEALDEQVFRGLRPSAVGAAEMAVGREGTVRAARRALGAPVLARGFVPKEAARLAGTVFQGERKSAVVEITPVRFAGHALVLARRVRVRLAFTGTAEGEAGRGSRGRSLPRRRGVPRDVVARLHTSARGLHAVRFEQLFPHGGRELSLAFLRLQRQGEAVAFHVEPTRPVFGPGSTLYFFADETAASTDYSPEVAYELVRATGPQMGSASADPLGATARSPSTGRASFETNRIYQPGLLEAKDVWLWQAASSGAPAPPAVSFSLSGLVASDPARLVVHLQGGSASGRDVDHHVRFEVNGVDVGETTFAGKLPHDVGLPVPASVLVEGDNALEVVNAGDTGVTSLVFLDRFEVSYPQVAAARQGVFEGTWGEGGAVEVAGLSGPPVILSLGVTPLAPGAGGTVRWVTGYQATPGSVRFQAQAGERYLVASPDELLAPRIEWPTVSTLRDAGNQADYLVIAPRAFVEAAQPLLERRRSQGLSSRAASFEEITSEFGHGRPSAEAIKEFLSYAYHSWQRPSPRYVLLLGDSTVDPRRFVATSGPSPLPALWTRTSYLWTVSDPALAAVNGEDLAPDLAIGRLPATSVEEAQRLVAKVLAWEESGEDLGGRAVLVADNPDRGGDFDANVEDIRASFLGGRDTTVLEVGELGAGTRAAILGAFDDGASLVSYVGHGGTTVWASENVLNNWDVPALRAQSRQPLLLTWNCLNGYFVTPNLDALPEALLKAEGRGVVGAFSPSGLSLDGPAHEYHRALVAELAGGDHERLGDAVVAAQRRYAETGLMPELIGVYQLMGDPATRLR